MRILCSWGGRNGRPFFDASIGALFCLLLFVASPAGAYTEVIDLFLDKGVDSLARGGLRQVLQRPEAADFQKPFTLDTDGHYRLESGYEYQRTVRVFDGRWKGSHVYSEKLGVTGAAPFSLMNEKIRGSVAAGYDYHWFEVAANNSQERIGLRSAENFEATKAGIHVNTADLLRIGMSVVNTDYRSAPEIPISAELSVAKELAVGYRRSFLDSAANFGVTLSGHSGIVPFRYREEINELYLTGTFRDIATISYSNELQKPDNREILWRVDLPGNLYGAGSYATRTLRFAQDFFVENKNGGYLAGTIDWRKYRFGMGAKLGTRWNLEANYQRLELDSNGGGIATSSAVLDFWPALLVGNYNHTYLASLVTDQYHLTTGYTGEQFSFNLGFQYLHMKTAANLDYWRSVLFGLGNTGAGRLTLDTDRIDMLFLSLGLGYQWSKVKLTYAIGQFIPLGTRNRTAATETGGGNGGGGGGGGADIWQGITDKINHNPGGNLQRILLTVTF